MRMAPHVMLALTAGSPQRAMYERWITVARPPLVKVCRQSCDNDLLAWTRAQGSRTLARYVDVALVSSGAENGRLARKVIGELTPYFANLDYIEFANEELQGKDDPKQWDILMEACLDFMIQLDAANKAAGRKGPKACIANTSVGQPELERWSRASTLETARYAAANSHVWGAHEYYKPDPWAMVDGGKAAWDGPAPAQGWLMLRVTKVRDIMRANGIDGYRFIITESGRDNVPGQPGQGGGFRDVMPGHPYAEFMAEYGRHLSAIIECIGWVDFGYNAWEGWSQFDLTLEPEEHERMVQAMAKLPRGAPSPPTPQPQPTPPETPPVNNVEAIIWAEVDKAHKLRGLPYTPSHALVAAAKIPAGVMLPTTDEITVTSAGGRYIAQRFQRSDTGAVIVLYCRDGVWNKIYRIAPESGGGADVAAAAGPAFAWPVGSTALARALPSIPPGWYVSVGFDQEYIVNGRAAVHPGLDLSDVRGGDTDLGAPVYAMADGVVTFSGYSAESWGNIVMVRHDDIPGYGTLWTQYAHLQARAVAVGDVVRQGQTVGTIGKGAGDRFAAHLHLEVRRMDLPATAWPGNSHGKVIAGYIDPRAVIGRVLGG